MNRIIAEIEAEVRRLQAARALLAGENRVRKMGKPGTRKRSAATKALLAEVDPPLQLLFKVLTAAHPWIDDI